MIKLALLTTTALFLAGPAFAGGDYKPEPPKPTPPTQIQGQAQGQAQGQLQGQGQQQRATSAATGGNATGGQGGAGGAGGRGGDQSQSTTVNNTGGGNGGWNGSQFPASSAYAPSFALSSICQEAISGGVSVFWAGASGGKVYTLDFCKMTMQADYYRKQGREDMAKAAECKFSEARSLYRETGTPCREDMTKAELTQPVAAAPMKFASRQDCIASLNATGQASADNIRNCNK